MHIVTNPVEATVLDQMTAFFHQFYPRESKSLALKAFDDWKTKRQQRIDKALKDQAVVAKSNSEQQHRGVDNIGQVNRRVAESLDGVIKELYGPHAVDDPKFMDRLDKDNNFGFKPHYDKKTVIIKP